MARTPSTMLPLGTAAPEFSLPNIDGKTVSLADFSSAKGLVVMFICNHCPFVKHVQDGLVSLFNDYSDKGIAFVGISSNDVENYPDDSPEKMSEEAAKAGYQFPYLYDADQSVAKAYRAACTPDFYLFDAEHKLVYRGQIDASRPKTEIPVTAEDMRKALDQLLAGQAPLENQTPSLGCNIKWIAGNEPDYYGAS